MNFPKLNSTGPPLSTPLHQPWEKGNFPACGPIRFSAVNDMHSNFGGETGGWRTTQKGERGAHTLTGLASQQTDIFYPKPSHTCFGSVLLTSRLINHLSS
ncbi:hypothetical protein XENORESO_009066 [Xenotaenia resolanae]|uniref:Uncharacterized protein n=1 Tax=Xenotaenia resolanae TaxID=208358 RepID=A0ABV0VLZ8_9TELE